MSDLVAQPDQALKNALDTDGRKSTRATTGRNGEGPDSSTDGAPPVHVLLEKYLGSFSDPRAAYQEISGWLKAQIKAQRWDDLAQALPRFIVPGLDYTSAGSLHRVLRQVAQHARTHDRRTKIAVLGSFTTHQLVSLFELYLGAGRVAAEVYEADYGTFRQELLDPESELYRFEPDVIVLATSGRDLGHRPELGADRPAVQRKVEAELADWTLLWRTAHERLGCQIIQNNFDTPPWRTLDNLEMRHPASLGRYVTLINLALQDAAPPYVTIHDIDHLSATWGRWEWGDERFYHHAKLPCSPEHLVDYAHSLASLILAQLGVVKKCLVLDLDNTLWGGVIGDDGLGGIRLGQGDPESESFVAFQRYVKGLRLRGVILAVCSKNTDSIAREVFQKHPEMVLRLDDIACFVANWDDKASNLARIAEQLNIGLNSLVFVDDNPAERAIVRQLRPEVAVPELPLDPSGYVMALERQRYFQPLALSTEDLKRTDYYLADSARQAAESTAEDLDAFLQSLEMTARIGPIEPATLDRSAQLIQRSNQFNLTTRRHSAADLQAMMSDPSWVTRTVSLRDRFGDNGLISVLLAKIVGAVLEVDTWLMSCRVLKRGVEQFLLNHLCEFAGAKGLRAVRGEYIPTAKNGLVRDHYANLGFTQLTLDDSGHTTWELRLHEGWTPPATFITENRPDGNAPL
jgi:FkbH-like protein